MNYFLLSTLAIWVKEGHSIHIWCLSMLFISQGVRSGRDQVWCFLSLSTSHYTSLVLLHRFQLLGA